MALSETTIMVYDGFVDFAREHGGNSPSVRQLAAIIGLSPNGVQIAKKELIDREFLYVKDGHVCITGATLCITHPKEPL